MSKSLFLSLSFVTITSLAFAGGIEKNLPSFVKPDLHLGLMQQSPDDFDFGNDDPKGRALSFGYIQFDSEKLNDYLAAGSSTHTSFAANYMAIGLDEIENNGEHWDRIGSIEWLLPQKISAGPADSLKLKLYGWHYTMSVLAWDFIPGEVVTLALGTQISYGNLKMKREVAGQKTKYTNPFIAPGGRAEFRLTFGKFMIGGRATYRYDITHALWKRKNDLMPVLPEYKNNGLAYFGYIGLMF